MKVLIVLAVFALSNGAKLDRTYLPPNAQTSGGSGNFLQTPNGSGFSQNGNYAANSNNYPQSNNGFAQNANAYNNDLGSFNQEDRPERTQAAFERNAAILRQDNQNDGESYSYAYETENGIVAEENGVATNGVEAQGGFSYTGDDGQVYSIRYTADQNGFVPQGDHLPTPPPVPEEILRALEQNERDEAAGIYDDGTYNEAKYAGEEQYDGNYGRGSSYSNDDSVVTNAADIPSGFDNQNNFGNQFARGNQGNIGNQAGYNNQGSFGRQSGNQGSRGTSNAYLPPSTNQRANGKGGFGSRNREGGFNGRNGYRH